MGNIFARPVSFGGVGMKDFDLLPGTLDLLVLQVLMQGPQHGYEIARFIREHSRGRFRVIDGALYTALHRLETRGLVTSHWGQSTASKRAKFYALTVSGRQAFRRETVSWYRYVTSVARVMTAKRPLDGEPRATA
jgi:PadR family transcriptional regulator, regulatory protein PadR